MNQALGWTILHSLWQGAAIALLLMAALALTRSPRVRYAAACIAMLMLLAAFGITFLRLMPSQAPRVIIRIPTFAPAFPTQDLPALPPHGLDLTDFLPWLAPIWMAGVLLFQLRFLASWLAAKRLRTVGVCGAPPVWSQKVELLSERLRLSRPVILLESCLTEVPVVVGHLRPVILMPVGLLTGLPAGQLELILLHELAHIRRADYFVNLVQSFFEGLLFYHPAAWWISRVIRNERENCCDDLVVAAKGDAHAYAVALAALAEHRYAQPALAATGGNLVKRIRRVLAQPEAPGSALGPLLTVSLLLLTCGAALVAWQTPQQSSPAIVPVTPISPPPPIQQTAPPPQPPAPPPPPAATQEDERSRRQSEALDHLHELMRKTEDRARQFSLAFQENQAPSIAADSPYEKWVLGPVAYIITNEERKAFKSLKDDNERELFIKQFWARRDPAYSASSSEQYPAIAKGNPENEFKKEFDRRVVYANDRFAGRIPGWKTDRGRIYIEYGPPDEIESHPNGGAYTRPSDQGGGQTETFPFEQWRYRHIEGIGDNIILEFVDTARSGEYRLTMDPNGKDVPQQAVFSSEGPGMKAIASVGMDRRVRITVPLDYGATDLSAKLERPSNVIMGLQHRALPDPCQGKAQDSGCKDTAMSKIFDAPLSRDAYTFTATVTDSHTGAIKTYVIHFSVN